MTQNAEPTVTPKLTQSLPQSAAVLAYAGALPLIIAAFLILLGSDQLALTAQHFMLVYGGAMIIFFGGIRWGVAVMRSDGPTFASLIGGAIPLFIGMPIFFIESVTLRFVMIVITLPLLLWDDLRATRRGSGAPDWYLGVRTPLTVLMLLSFAFGFAASVTGGS